MMTSPIGAVVSNRDEKRRGKRCARSGPWSWKEQGRVSVVHEGEVGVLRAAKRGAREGRCHEVGVLVASR